MTETVSTPLNSANLKRLAPEVRVPGYDRAAVAPSIVHIGVGGFYRAIKPCIWTTCCTNPAILLGAIAGSDCSLLTRACATL